MAPRHPPSRQVPAGEWALGVSGWHHGHSYRARRALEVKPGVLSISPVLSRVRSFL